MATFLELTDTPVSYTGETQFVITAGNQLDFITLSTNELVDVNTFGAYAPTDGQTLVWNEGAGPGGNGEFRPGTIDPYTAGTGISKLNGVLTISVASGGGLFANVSGLFIEDVGNISGTYGNASFVPSFTVNNKGQITSISAIEGEFAVASSLNADHVLTVTGTSGQIIVDGGTGIASTAKVSLVATGVTAATYGNSTHSPVITVDSYGRIQNVDVVEVSGGGIVDANGNIDLSNVTTLAFKNIAVDGQTTISADTKDDTVTFVAGSGMTITTNAGSDNIIFSSSGGGGASVTVSDNPPLGPSNGDLWWDSSTGKLKIYYDDLSSQQWVDANPASGSSADYSTGALIVPVTESPASDEGSISWNPTTDTLYIGNGTTTTPINVHYSDSDVQAYLDSQGYSNVDLDAQTLIWDNANSNLSISAGNTITLFDQSLDTTDTVTFNQVNTEDVTGANQLILSAGASGITASTNGNQQFNATSGSIFLVTPTVDAQESAFLANTITANSLTISGTTFSSADLAPQTLTWDSGNSNLSISGGNTVTLTGVGGGITAVVDDTTPQLGGNLDINSKFITGALIPDTNNTYDLGTAELKWRDLYLNSGSIYLGSVVLSTVANVLQANVEGTLKNVSFGGDPVVSSSLKPEPTNTEAVNGTDTFISGGDALGTNSIGGVLNLQGGSGAIGNGFINIGGDNTSEIYMGTASIPSTITGSTVTITADTRLRRVKEVLSSLTNATGVVVHDCSNGHIFDHTSITADFTVNLTNLNLPVGHATSISLVLHQGATAFIPTAVQFSGTPQTLLWQGGSQPTGTNNGTDVVSLSILNVGGSYTILGQLVGFS